MGDPKPYSRVQSSARLRPWLRDRRMLLIRMSSVMAGLIAINAFVLSLTMPDSVRWAFIGGMVGAAAIGICWMMHLSFVVHDRSAVYELRGAWGEDFTRDVLKRARRRRQIWGVVNGLATQRGDIDHIVVSRNGGLVVIDSKFRTELTAKDWESMIEAGRGHRRSMEALARSIITRSNGRHRGQERLPITPAIVLWGPARREVAKQVVEGVHLMSGDDLYGWLKDLDGESIPKAFGRELTDALREWAERQRKESAARATAPAGS